MIEWHKIPSSRLYVFSVLTLGIGLLAIACSKQQPSIDEESGITLKFVHSITLGLERDLMDDIVSEFNAAHEGVTLIQERMEADYYEDLGVIKHLESGNPPDLYFEWGGWRLKRCVAKGWALDLTPYMNDGWRDRFFDICSDYMDYEGGTYLSPNGLDITTLLFYNADLFQELEFQVPADWPEFVELCKKTKAAGIIPITSGNEEVWPMGNWAAHIASRIVGEDHYADILSLKEGTSLTDPGFVKTLEMLKEIGDFGGYNSDINGLAAVQGQVPLLQGHALFHPIGIWVMDDWAKDNPDFNFDFFNTPPIPGGKGDQSSLLGVVSGYMVHKKSLHPDLAVEFLKYVSSPEVQRRFLAIGHSSATKEAFDGVELDPKLARIREMLKSGHAIVPPADTGFQIGVSEEFYKAAAAVLVGYSEPLEALERAERGITRFRREAK